MGRKVGFMIDGLLDTCLVRKGIAIFPRKKSYQKLIVFRSGIITIKNGVYSFLCCLVIRFPIMCALTRADAIQPIYILLPEPEILKRSCLQLGGECTNFELKTVTNGKQIGEKKRNHQHFWPFRSRIFKQ